MNEQSQPKIPPYALSTSISSPIFPSPSSQLVPECWLFELSNQWRVKKATDEHRCLRAHHWALLRQNVFEESAPPCDLCPTNKHRGGDETRSPGADEGQTAMQRGSTISRIVPRLHGEGCVEGRVCVCRWGTGCNWGQLLHGSGQDQFV